MCGVVEVMTMGNWVMALLQSKTNFNKLWIFPLKIKKFAKLVWDVIIPSY